jgi:hypothetical protein
MSLLIAVKSCQHDMERNDHQVIRNTWGSALAGADLQFFIGLQDGEIEEVPNLEADESRVMAPDDYDSLTLKTIEIVRWARKLKYDYVFLADTDTYLIPWRLMTSGFENLDFGGLTTKEFGKIFRYSGRTRGGKDFTISNCYPWCSGGYGYFLSKKAMDLILAAPTPTDPVMIWCEDMFVGQILGPEIEKKNIKAAGIENFRNMSWHFPQGEYNSGYDPKFGWMEKVHKEHQWS